MCCKTIVSSYYPKFLQQNSILNMVQRWLIRIYDTIMIHDYICTNNHEFFYFNGYFPRMYSLSVNFVLTVFSFHLWNYSWSAVQSRNFISGCCRNINNANLQISHYNSEGNVNFKISLGMHWVLCNV